MKRIYSLIALCIGLLASSLQLKADYYTIAGVTVDDEFPVESVIEPGTYYALGITRVQPENDNWFQYFGPNGLVSLLDDSDLWAFLPISTDSRGNTVYVLRQKSSGLYLAPGRTLKQSPDRAWKFTALPANIVDNSGYVEDEEDTYIDWTEYDARTASASQANNGNYYQIDGTEELPSFVFCQAPVDQETPVYLSNLGGFNNYRDTNNWFIQKVEPVSAYRALEIWLTNNSFDGDAYADKVGNDIGQFDAELFETTLSAWETILEMEGDESVTDEMVSTAITAFDEARLALGNSLKVFGPGYYVFTGARSTHPSIYCSDDHTALLSSVEFEMPESAEDWTVGDCRYIWEFKEIDGKTYLRSFYANGYLENPGGLYNVLPVVDEPTTSFNVEANTYNETGEIGWFNIMDLSIDPETNQTGYSGYEAGAANCLHHQVNGNKLVYWSKGAIGSLWRVRVVPQSVIDYWQDRLAQETINEDINLVVTKAERAYESTQKLVKSEKQFRSNTADTGEGPGAAPFDGDYGTYWHSTWRGDASDTHNFQVDLGAALDEITVMIATRNHQNRTEPTRLVVKATNEVPTFFDKEMYPEYNKDLRDEDLTEWTELADTLVMEYTEKYADSYGFIARTTYKMPQAYRYLRFDLDENTAGVASRAYMSFSELQITAPDKGGEPTGVLAAMDKAVLTEFLAALQEAKEAVAAGNGTTEILNRIRAAYAAFVEYLPQPENLTAAKNNAQEWLDSSMIGTGIGMYPQTAADKLQNVLDGVVVEEVMTLADINAGIATVESALEDFQKSLTLPTEGSYLIRCQSTGAAGQNYARASRFGESPLSWGGYNQDLQADEDVIKYRQDPSYLWMLTAASKDGKTGFTLRNYGTGAYLRLLNNNPRMTADADSALIFTLQSARIDSIPAFNIVLAESRYLNFQPDGKAIVGWGTAKGADNSALTFEAFQPNDIQEIFVPMQLTVGLPQIVTFPYDVRPYGTSEDNIALYDCIGQDSEGNYHFAEKNMDEDFIIPAATPFLALAKEGANMDMARMIATAKNLAALTFSEENEKNENGLVGVITDTEAKLDCGIFYDYPNLNRLSPTEETDVILAGTGYFTTVEATSVKGDLVIKGFTGIVYPWEEADGIVQITVRQPNGSTFNLMGQKVTGKLPAGLYIINGKKTLVK